jgi:RNA polymerase sigma-70 factor (ECF subfamily)
MLLVRDDAFERLYAEHAESLLGFLAYRTGNQAVAEDLLADTFERVLKARRRFDPRKSSEKTWLYTIALNLLRDHARRSGAEARAVDRATAGPPDEAHSALEQIDARDSLARALELLSPEERDAIALRYGADLTVPEIAELVGEPLTAVEGRVYRALRKLRDALDEGASP